MPGTIALVILGLLGLGFLGYVLLMWDINKNPEHWR